MVRVSFIATIVAAGEPRSLAEVNLRLRQRNRELLAAVKSARAQVAAALLRMEQGGTLSATQAKVVLADLLAHGGDPAELARRHGFEAMAADSLSVVVGELIAAHPDEWARYVGGEEQLAGFFTGLAMKATDRKANGKAVAAELRTRRG